MFVGGHIGKRYETTSNTTVSVCNRGPPFQSDVGKWVVFVATLATTFGKETFDKIFSNRGHRRSIRRRTVYGAFFEASPSAGIERRFWECRLTRFGGLVESLDSGTSMAGGFGTSIGASIDSAHFVE